MKNKFNYSDANLAVFDQVMDEYGWIIYEDALDDAFVNEINDSLIPAYDVRRKIQIANGIGDNMNGTLHHLVERERFFIEVS